MMDPNIFTINNNINIDNKKQYQTLVLDLDANKSLPKN